jgi:hypothetical protein
MNREKKINTSGKRRQRKGPKYNCDYNSKCSYLFHRVYSFLFHNVESDMMHLLFLNNTQEFYLQL